MIDNNSSFQGRQVSIKIEENKETKGNYYIKNDKIK